MLLEVSEECANSIEASFTTKSATLAGNSSPVRAEATQDFPTVNASMRGDRCGSGFEARNISCEQKGVAAVKGSWWGGGFETILKLLPAAISTAIKASRKANTHKDRE